MRLNSSRITAFAVTGLFVLALFYTLSIARAVFLPLVLAILFNFLLTPPVRGLRRLRIPTPLGAGIILLTVLGGSAYGVSRLSDPVAAWAKRAPTALKNAQRKLRKLRRPVEEVAEAVNRSGLLDDSPADRHTQLVENKPRSFIDWLLTQTSPVIATLLSTFVLLFFFLAGGELFLRKMIAMSDDEETKRRVYAVCRRIEHDLSTYFLAVTIINCGLGVAVGVAMAFLEMPTPIVWGAMAALLNFVPYVGALVGTAVVFLISLLTFEGAAVLLPPAAYMGFTALEGGLITPSIIGRPLACNSVAVFLSLLLWGFVWGIPGMIVAVPILAAVKVVCDHIPPLQPVARLLSSGSPENLSALRRDQLATEDAL